MAKEFYGSINLEALIHVKKQMKTQDGRMVDVLIIPVEANQLYPGEKSTSANIRIRLHDKKDQYGNDGFIAKTDSIKPLFGEGVKYIDLTAEQQEQLKKLSPILGNIKASEQSVTNNEVKDTFENELEDEGLLF